MVPLFQDELQTTTKSYEGQLSMMSEHLAGMNEKLTQQKDEIDDLRSQLSVAKVSTSKVHALFMLTNFNVYTLFISSVFKITLFRVSMHVLYLRIVPCIFAAVIHFVLKDECKICICRHTHCTHFYFYPVL